MTLNFVSQNYLIFQPIYNTFIRITVTETVIAWQSKGLSTEIIKSLLHQVINSLSRKIANSKTEAKFIGSFLKQDQSIFTYRNAVNLFFVCDLDTCSKNFNTDFTL